MSYWIFVINGTNKEFAKRMKEKRWPIFIHTQNRKNLRIGDQVVFYKPGLDEKNFLVVLKLNLISKRKPT